MGLLKCELKIMFNKLLKQLDKVMLRCNQDLMNTESEPVENMPWSIFIVTQSEKNVVVIV